MSTIAAIPFSGYRAAGLQSVAASPPTSIDNAGETEGDELLICAIRAASQVEVMWKRVCGLLCIAKSDSGERNLIPGSLGELNSIREEELADLVMMQWKRRTAMDAFAGAMIRLADFTADEQVGGEGFRATSDSHRMFYDNVIALIESLDARWLSMYENALSGYIGFFERLTSIMALQKDAIDRTDDKGNLKVDFSAVRDGLTELLLDLQEPGSGLASFTIRSDAESFIEELGLSSLKVRPDSERGYEVYIDDNTIVELRDTLPAGASTIDPAKYSAIMSAKDSLMERFNHANIVLSDKYKYQMQVWDTLVRALSSGIQSMDEAQRTFIHNL